VFSGLQSLGTSSLLIADWQKNEIRKWKLAKAEVGPIFDFPVSTFSSSSQSAIIHRPSSPVLVAALPSRYTGYNPYFLKRR
jgi:hypothetical protein